jgi:hypothetical protein
MKRLLTVLPLLAAIGVASYSAMHHPGHPGTGTGALDAVPAMPTHLLPQGHPAVEQWAPVLPEGHPPLLPRNPYLPEGHPPIPGHAGDCPGLRGEAGGNTDMPAVDAQELIST